MIRRVAAGWHARRWLRGAPGIAGAIVVAAFPVLYLADVNHELFGGNWPGWSGGWSVIGVLVLAGVLGRDVAKPRPAWLWLYQKRASVADAAMTGWLMNFALATVAFAWWAVALHLAAYRTGNAAETVAAASLGHWLTLFGISTALLYVTGALRLEHGVEILIVGVAAGAMEPLASLAFPPPVGAALHLLLPPITDARMLRAGAMTGDWSTVARSLAHVLAFVGVCLAAGTLMLSRWRPREL